MTALIIPQELPSASLARQCSYSLSVHKTELITRTQKSSPRDHPLVSIRVNHRERKLNVNGDWPNCGFMAINLSLTGKTGRFYPNLYRPPRISIFLTNKRDCRAPSQVHQARGGDSVQCFVFC